MPQKSNELCIAIAQKITFSFHDFKCHNVRFLDFCDPEYPTASPWKETRPWVHDKERTVHPDSHFRTDNIPKGEEKKEATEGKEDRGDFLTV